MLGSSGEFSMCDCAYSSQNSFPHLSVAFCLRTRLTSQQTSKSEVQNMTQEKVCQTKNFRVGLVVQCKDDK